MESDFFNDRASINFYQGMSLDLLKVFKWYSGGETYFLPHNGRNRF